MVNSGKNMQRSAQGGSSALRPRTRAWLELCREYTGSENYRRHLGALTDAVIAEANEVHGEAWGTLVFGMRTVYAAPEDIREMVVAGRLGDMERAFRDRTGGHAARTDGRLGVMGVTAVRLRTGDVRRYSVLSPSRHQHARQQEVTKAWFDDLELVGLAPWDLAMVVVDRRGDGTFAMRGAALWGREMYLTDGSDLTGWFTDVSDAGTLIPDLENSARQGMLMRSGARSGGSGLERYPGKDADHQYRGGGKQDGEADGGLGARLPEQHEGGDNGEDPYDSGEAQEGEHG